MPSDSMRMRIAINGWPLMRQPSSPAALHLRELLDMLAAAEPPINLLVLHPGDQLESPPAVDTRGLGGSRSSWGRLRFEQSLMPRAAAQAGADVLLSTLPGGALRSPVPQAFVSRPQPAPVRSSLLERLRWALGTAGMHGAAAAYSYADLPLAARMNVKLRRLAPSVGPRFRPVEESDDRARRSAYDLEAGYVLCHGATRESVPTLLAAWTWVEGSMGDAVPLVLLGLDAELKALAAHVAADLDLEDSVINRPEVDFESLPAIYRGAEACLHPGTSETGQELRWALASGIPIAAPETADTRAVCGDAAYLSPPGDARGLGAACLTLLVEPDEVARPLRQKGLLRAAAYHEPASIQVLIDGLYQAAGRSHGASQGQLA